MGSCILLVSLIVAVVLVYVKNIYLGYILPVCILGIILGLSILLTVAVRSEAELKTVLNEYLQIFFPQAFLYSSILIIVIILLYSLFQLLSNPVNYLSKAYIQITKDDTEIPILVGAVISGGIGGVIKAINPILLAFGQKKYDDINNIFFLFWKFILSTLKGATISMAIILALRAGLLKNVDLDTFNIYGVTGFGIFIGLYSDKILAKFATNIQNKLIPKDGSST